MHKRLLESLGWRVIIQDESQLFLRPFGPVAIAKIQRPRLLDLPWLADLRKQHHILTLFIEPGLSAPSLGKLGIPVEPFAHSATSLLDLTQDASSLLASFSQKTRYNIIRNLKKDALSIISTPLKDATRAQRHDLMMLRDSWGRAKKVIGYAAPLLENILMSYKHHASLHLAYTQTRECVGALLILTHDAVATYYAAFAQTEGYHLHAPTLLTWQALITARKNGCDIFDFGGIYDPRYPKLYRKWQGFTKFKSGFHPTVVSYPPTYLKLFW